LRIDSLLAPGWEELEMSDGAPLSGTLRDLSSTSSAASGNEARLPNEAQTDPIASLRSALKETLAEEPKSQSRFLGFLHRRRIKESAVGVRATLAPREFAFVGTEISLEPPPYASFGMDAPAEPAAFEEAGSENLASSGHPAEAMDEEEPRAGAPSAEPMAEDWFQPEFPPVSALNSDTGADAEAAAPTGAEPEQLIGAAFSDGGESATVESAEQTLSLRGEVLPPEIFRSNVSGSAPEPARVITMQPAVARPGSDSQSNPTA
jgi:hypothetical protein